MRWVQSAYSLASSEGCYNHTFTVKAPLQRHHFAVALYRVGWCPGNRFLICRVETEPAGDVVLLEVVSWIYQVVALETIYLVIRVGASNCVVPARTDADTR
jgi:hypothetical protein